MLFPFMFLVVWPLPCAGVRSQDIVAGSIEAATRVASSSTATVLEVAAPPKQHWIRIRAPNGFETWIATQAVKRVERSLPVTGAHRLATSSEASGTLATASGCVPMLEQLIPASPPPESIHMRV